MHVCMSGSKSLPVHQRAGELGLCSTEEQGDLTGTQGKAWWAMAQVLPASPGYERQRGIRESTLCAHQD
jgi:hypothetical protein